MPGILTRIFFLYNLLHSIILYLLPKKLRTNLPSTCCYNLPSPHLLPSSSSASLFPSPSSQYSPMHAHELTRVFHMFDRNGDGRITQQELSDSLENMGIFIPAAELSQMIDIDGDGCVDLGELYRTLTEEPDEEEDRTMREAFNVYDQNGDGFITVDELTRVLPSLGLKQGGTAEEGRMMIRRVDEDGDGKVNFNEFKQMIKAGQVALQH